MTDLNNEGGGDRAIDDCAARGAAQRLSGEFSRADEGDLRAWLTADPRHATAFAEYLAIAETSAHAGAIGGFKQAANGERTATAAYPRRSWLIGAPAIAASLFAAFVFFGPARQTPAQPDTYATVRGETRDVTLPDGSVVTLNTDTVISFTANDTGRYAVLDSGEVFFDIARDEERPFVVEAGDIRATVLGTTFTIRKDVDESIVRVLSGVVAVQSGADGRNEPGVRLAQGQQISVAATGAVSDVNPFDPGVAATWRHGYLYFDNTPLSHVVADLNRYFVPQIELENAALGDAPISGRIELESQDVAIRALSAALSLKASQEDADKIVLRADG